MRVYLLLLFLSLPLFSSTIVGHNIYKQDDSLDLMLTFDEPYLGKISKKSDGDDKILILANILIDKNITKTIDSKIAQKMEIIKAKDQTHIMISSNNSFVIKASKTIDNYGLRIRVKPFILQPIKEKTYETKAQHDISNSFLKVIAVLAFLLLVLYILKRWLTRPTSDGWLFNKNPTEIKEIKVINQKALDTKNRVCIIEYNGYEYLTILGNNNILLDKFSKDQTTKFDQLLDQNSDQLKELINQH